MRSLLAVWNSLQILYCKRWTRTARPERGFLFRLYLCSVMLGRAGYATRCCNIKWLSQNQQYMLSSSLHIFSPWTHKLIVCMLHCFSLPLMSLFTLPFLSSSLLPFLPFPFLPLPFLALLPHSPVVSFYRSNCSNQLHKRRLWQFWECVEVECWANYPPYSGKCHHRCETGMFKSVDNLYLKNTTHNM